MTTIKLAASDLIPALRNVAMFSSSDDTLPTLTGVTLDYSETGVTLAATDRYMLARQDIPAEVDGESGMIAIDRETVKQLLTVKPTGYDAPTVIESGEAEWSADLPGGVTLKRSHDRGLSVFKFRPLWDRMISGLDGQDSAEATAPARVRWNARYLARFAKVRGGEIRGPNDVYMTMIQHPTQTHALIKCGPLDVMAMSIKIAS